MGADAYSLGGSYWHLHVCLLTVLIARVLALIRPNHVQRAIVGVPDWLKWPWYSVCGDDGLRTTASSPEDGPSLPDTTRVGHSFHTHPAGFSLSVWSLSATVGVRQSFQNG